MSLGDNSALGKLDPSKTYQPRILQGGEEVEVAIAQLSIGDTVLSVLVSGFQWAAACSKARPAGSV